MAEDDFAFSFVSPLAGQGSGGGKKNKLIKLPGFKAKAARSGPWPFSFFNIYYLLLILINI